MRDRGDTATLRTAAMPMLAPHFVRSIRRRAARRLLYPILRPWLLAGEVLPRRMSSVLWQGVSLSAFAICGAFRERAIENIRSWRGSLSEEEARRIARECFRSCGRSASDVPRLRRISREALLDMVEMSGYERLRSAVARGRGVVAVVPHIGNWELLACYVAARGLPVAVVAAEVYSARLGDYLVSLRRRWGVETIVRGRSGASRRAIEVLRDGGVLGTLMDLRTRTDGVSALFLGRETEIPAGPVRLALRTGAELVPVWIARNAGGGYRAEALEAIRWDRCGDAERDLREGVRQAARVMEGLVTRRPEQWLWMHEQWPSWSRS